jgi:hypothetical protein
VGTQRRLQAAGFVEASHTPDDARFSVGVHRFVGDPRQLPLTPRGTLFQFVS